MRYFFSLFLLFLSPLCLADSFGVLPLPNFKLAVPYPQGWQHNINMGMGGAFVSLDFTQNKEDEKSPSVYFMAAKTTQMMQMGMGGMGGAIKGMGRMPGGAMGGRWMGTQTAPAGSQSPSSPSVQTGGGETAAAPQNLSASNKTIVWLGQKTEKIDSTETLEDGQIVRTRGVTATLGDKNVMMSCSAPIELFTVEFASMCDRLIKGVKRIR